MTNNNVKYGSRNLSNIVADDSIKTFTDQIRGNLQNITLLSNLRRDIVTVLEDFIRFISAYPPRIQQFFPVMNHNQR